MKSLYQIIQQNLASFPNLQANNDFLSKFLFKFIKCMLHSCLVTSQLNTNSSTGILDDQVLKVHSIV